jgi:heme-degrading monooxygenase HmoA
VIVREWSGTVRADDAPAYLALMRRHALADYQRVPGNLGAQVWHRAEAEDTVRFVTVSWWESLAAVAAFAGDDIDAATYYSFDDDYLIDRGPRVRHYLAHTD